MSIKSYILYFLVQMSSLVLEKQKLNTMRIGGLGDHQINVQAHTWDEVTK